MDQFDFVRWMEKDRKFFEKHPDLVTIAIKINKVDVDRLDDEYLVKLLNINPNYKKLIPYHVTSPHFVNMYIKHDPEKIKYFTELTSSPYFWSEFIINNNSIHEMGYQGSLPVDIAILDIDPNGYKYVPEDIAKSKEFIGLMRKYDQDIIPSENITGIKKGDLTPLAYFHSKYTKEYDKVLLEDFNSVLDNQKDNVYLLTTNKYVNVFNQNLTPEFYDKFFKYIYRYKGFDSNKFINSFEENIKNAGKLDEIKANFKEYVSKQINEKNISGLFDILYSIDDVCRKGNEEYINKEILKQFNDKLAVDDWIKIVEEYRSFYSDGEKFLQNIPKNIYENKKFLENVAKMQFYNYRSYSDKDSVYCYFETKNPELMQQSAEKYLIKKLSEDIISDDLDTFAKQFNKEIMFTDEKISNYKNIILNNIRQRAMEINNNNELDIEEKNEQLNELKQYKDEMNEELSKIASERLEYKEKRFKENFENVMK